MSGFLFFFLKHEKKNAAYKLSHHVFSLQLASCLTKVKKRNFDAYDIALLNFSSIFLFYTPSFPLRAWENFNGCIRREGLTYVWQI